MEQIKSSKLPNQAVDSENEAFVQMMSNILIWDDINFHQPGDGILAGRTGGSQGYRELAHFREGNRAIR